MASGSVLAIVWFVVVAFFWTGFFVLEGFDFGVGALHRLLGRTDLQRRVVINTIGPFWDANEVWLVVAGAAMFAAFPAWYASWFSSLYLALWLLLVALILRGVSFEFRGKFAGHRWRSTWSTTLTIGSFAAPFLIGVGLGACLAGLPIGVDGEFTGAVLDLLTPFGLAFGATLLVLCLLHGAAFLTLRTTGVLVDRAARLVRLLGPVAAVLVAVVAIWMLTLASVSWWRVLAAAVPVVSVTLAAAVGRSGRRAGATFVATTVGIGGTVAALFVAMYPNLLVAVDPAHTLTVANSSASAYSLQVMSVVAAVLVPVVLGYQGWAYHVFRRRVVGPAGGPARPAPPGPEPDPIPPNLTR